MVKQVTSLVVECPACRKETMQVSEYIYNAPLIGDLLLSISRCSSCGYTHRDVKLLESRPPRRIKYRVETPDDLRTLVVKSSSSSIIIPEVGLSMEPGPASYGFITTIEGIIDRFFEVLEAVCTNLSNKESCEEAHRQLNEVKEVKKPYTIIIVDPDGTSYIASDKAVIEPINKPE